MRARVPTAGRTVSASSFFATLDWRLTGLFRDLGDARTAAASLLRRCPGGVIITRLESNFPASSRPGDTLIAFHSGKLFVPPRPSTISVQLWRIENSVSQRFSLRGRAAPAKSNGRSVGILARSRHLTKAKSREQPDERQFKSRLIRHAKWMVRYLTTRVPLHFAAHPRGRNHAGARTLRTEFGNVATTRMCIRPWREIGRPSAGARAGWTTRK